MPATKKAVSFKKPTPPTAATIIKRRSTATENDTHGFRIHVYCGEDVLKRVDEARKQANKFLPPISRNLWVISAILAKLEADEI